MRRDLNAEKGFTLVEVMIVVAVIALLAAIAIPNLLRARLNANEEVAIASLRMISTACENFRAAQSPVAYPTTLAELGPLAQAPEPGYIDLVLATGTKQGYNFVYNGTANAYICIASPVTPNVTGERSFFVDESGVVRFEKRVVPNVLSLPVD